MKSILIMRHGKSSWKDSSLPDNKRPLKKRGRKDSARIGELLKKHDLIPDLLLSSPAKRARQTAEVVAEAMEFDGEIEFVDAFYMAEPESFFGILRSLPDVGRIMIIGHNPGLETLVHLLADEINSMPTAALACIELPIEEWSQLDLDVCGDLKLLWRPRDLD